MSIVSYEMLWSSTCFDLMSKKKYTDMVGILVAAGIIFEIVMLTT